MKNRFRPYWKKWMPAILATALTVIMAQGVQANDRTLMMATTTSTDNTGLLDYLIPHFEAHTGITLKWTSTGTGKALALGQNCDVDVLLVHSPAAEESFIRKGYGKDRRQIMYNDFVIIGPDADPAGIRNRKISEALTAIKNAGVFFMSRGDDSGTNKKEQLLWKNAGITLPDKESWYIQTGQGMLATINVTQERKGYTMTDRGTYIKYQHQQGGNAPLKILVDGDNSLLNQYSVLTLDPANCPGAEYDLALVFSDWMASSHARELIKHFRLLDQPLFIPNAGQ
jgi:tungstate transport system substrate-binding protein